MPSEQPAPPPAPPSLAHTRVAKKLGPLQAGARKLHRRFGDALVCVRYRHDLEAGLRYTTVELVIAKAPLPAATAAGIVDAAPGLDCTTTSAASPQRSHGAGAAGRAGGISPADTPTTDGDDDDETSGTGASPPRRQPPRIVTCKVQDNQNADHRRHELPPAPPPPRLLDDPLLDDNRWSEPPPWFDDWAGCNDAEPTATHHQEADDEVFVKILFAETARREAARHEGARWDAEFKVWRMPFSTAKKLKLLNRIVPKNSHI